MAVCQQAILACCLALILFTPRAAAIILLIEQKECIIDRVEAGELVTGSFVIVDADTAWIADDSYAVINFEVSDGLRDTKLKYFQKICASIATFVTASDTQPSPKLRPLGLLA